MDGYIPRGNRFDGNVLSDNATDILFAATDLTDAGENCFVGNQLATSLPTDIETLMPCDAAAKGFTMPRSPQTAPPPKVDYRKIPAPADQPTMRETARRATAGAGEIPAVDIDSIGVPTQ